MRVITQQAEPGIAMQRLLVTACVLLLSACAQQQVIVKPDADLNALGFGHYRLGMSRAAIGKSFSCSRDEIDVDLACVAERRIDDPLAGHAVAELTLGFFDERLHHIAVQTQKGAYRDLVTVFRQSYGAGREATAAYAAADGSPLTGRTSVWALPQGSVTAVELCTDALSCVSFESVEYTARVASKRAATSR